MGIVWDTDVNWFYDNRKTLEKFLGWEIHPKGEKSAFTVPDKTILRILFMEAHIDDTEVGASLFISYLIELAKKNPNDLFELCIFTFCKYGRSNINDNGLNRFAHRMKMIRELNKIPNIVIVPLFAEDVLYDTTMEDFNIPNLIKLFNISHSNYSNIRGTSKWDAIVFAANDLHPDHCKVNNIAKIVSREKMLNIPKTMEYKIHGSWDQYVEFEADEIYTSIESINQDPIKWCLFPDEISNETILRQKNAKFLHYCDVKFECNDQFRTREIIKIKEN